MPAFPGLSSQSSLPLSWLGESGIGSSAISQHAVGAMLSAAFAPYTHAASQMIAMGANRLNSVQTPSFEQILKLWHGNNVGDNVLNSFARLHGIDIGQGQGRANEFQALWRLYVDKSRPIPPMELVRKWYRQGRIEANAYFEASRRHGYGSWSMDGTRGQPFRDLIATDYENLPADTLRHNYLLDPTQEPEIRRRLIMLGYPPESIAMIFNAMRSVPGITDALKFYQRKLISAPELDNAIFANGITGGADRAHVLEMLKAMPGEGELIGTAANNGWDDERAARWGLDRERPEQFDLWASRMGTDYGSKIDNADQSRYAGISWQEMAWRNHWQIPSIAILREWLHRFRGNPEDGATWTDPTYRPITDDEKRDIFQAAGVPVEMRRHYERLLWEPMSIRHIRIVYAREMVPQLDDNGQIRLDANNQPIMGRHPRAWLQDKLMSMGINSSDANSISRAYKQEQDDKDNAPTLRLKRKHDDKYIKEVEQAYRVGSASREQAQGQLTTRGIPDDVARTITSTIDLANYTSVITAVIKRTKADYLTGRTNADGAASRMNMAGVQPERVRLYVQAWAAEFGEGRRHLSTERILRSLRKGFISEAEAITRLDNLGWAKPDELIMLAEVTADVDKEQVALAKAGALAAEKQAQAMQRLLAKNQAAKEKIIGVLRRSASPAAIVKWMADGIWTESDGISRLKAMQIDDAAINAMLADARVKASGSVVTEDQKAAKTRVSLRALYPPAKIEKWLKDGIWSVEQAEAMLRKQGYTDDAIAARIADATRKDNSSVGNS